MTQTSPLPGTTSALAHSTASQKVFTASVRLLGALVWSSTLLFGLYILAFYAVPFYQQDMASWNETLNNLYTEGENTATIGIGIHFVAGGIILILGCLQFLSVVRNQFPEFHRWVGRVYVTAALFTALGGLVFIVAKGTIGGVVMSVGFGLYGVLMALTAVMTITRARQRRFAEHRVWALRLFALAIGSWLYRMDYGFWYLFTGNAGHNATFTGPFDYFMDFFFFLPNLLVVELIVRAKQGGAAPMIQLGSSLILFVASGFVVLGTYAFTKLYWGPAILALF